MQPFRFIHASNLLLDHDFRFPRSPSDVLDSLTEDCTQAAFQQIVETALAENVDFLLLAGNSFSNCGADCAQVSCNLIGLLNWTCFCRGSTSWPLWKGFS